MEFVRAFEQFMKQLVSPRWIFLQTLVTFFTQTILVAPVCVIFMIKFTLVIPKISSCDMPSELASIPLVFEDPLYGTEDLTFTDFMAPGSLKNMQD